MLSTVISQVEPQSGHLGVSLKCCSGFHLCQQLTHCISGGFKQSGISGIPCFIPLGVLIHKEEDRG
ncbi:hypothetical protein ES703_24972 [subsurface metagenome]